MLSPLVMSTPHHPVQPTLHCRKDGLIQSYVPRNSGRPFAIPSNSRELKPSLSQFIQRSALSGAGFFFGSIDMKKAMQLARQIGRRKTVYGRRKAVLAWCAEVKRMLS